MYELVFFNSHTFPPVAGGALVGAAKLMAMVRIILLTLLLVGTGEARPRPNELGCQKNLRDLGTAIEMYSTDNQGQYPSSLKAICPQYLASIPTCPSARVDSYSASYTSERRPDSYVVYCCGSFHPSHVNHPAFTSVHGLVERPGATTLGTCQENIKRAAQLVREYRKKHKKLPDKLSQVAAPVCPGSSAEYLYHPRPNRQDFVLECGGLSAHLGDNIRPYQPRYDSAASAGVVSEVSPVVAAGPPQPEPLGANQMQLAGLMALAVFLGLVTLGPRAR